MLPSAVKYGQGGANQVTKHMLSHNSQYLYRPLTDVLFNLVYVGCLVVSGANNKLHAAVSSNCVSWGKSSGQTQLSGLHTRVCVCVCVCA